MGNNDKGKFKCLKCLKQFRSKKALSSHIEATNHRALRSLEESKYVSKPAGSAST